VGVVVEPWKAAVVVHAEMEAGVFGDVVGVVVERGAVGIEVVLRRNIAADA